MSHKKAGGSAKSLRDSNAQYLGTKLYGGQKAQTGSIIVRQRGTKIEPGLNVGVGKDHSLFALIDGVVSYSTRRKTAYNGKIVRKKVVNVMPMTA